MPSDNSIDTEEVTNYGQHNSNSPLTFGRSVASKTKLDRAGCEAESASLSLFGGHFSLSSSTARGQIVRRTAHHNQLIYSFINRSQNLSPTTECDPESTVQDVEAVIGLLGQLGQVYLGTDAKGDGKMGFLEVHTTDRVDI
ncbi:hypothetical protein BLNAU_17211 [Blattamonas nauphoetae]|uniref:Uncharacterized protein n=1 Tax=Blattamonas nauphoetae TaxID=2049346 RepID=A0ABQ9X7L3_9EUKA|nr:hypothetical protein BLNAU_17211 [Blattamonas nauphoetae]